MLSTPTVSHPTELERSDGEEVNSRPQLHAVIISLIATLGGYLQLQYQSRNMSPFEEHINIMEAIWVTLFSYGTGLIAEYKLRMQNPIFISIITRFNPLIGILVVVLLLIMLFPMLGFMASILWALLMVQALMKSIPGIPQWICRRVLGTRGTLTTDFGSPSSARSEENHSTVAAENGFPGEEGNDLFPV